MAASISRTANTLSATHAPERIRLSPGRHVNVNENLSQVLTNI